MSAMVNRSLRLALGIGVLLLLAFQSDRLRVTGLGWPRRLSRLEEPRVSPAIQTETRDSVLELRGWQAAAALGAVGLITMLSISRYILSFDGTYGSGDAHLMLTRALFIREWQLQPSVELAISHRIFDQPPLIPAVLAAFSKGTGIPLQITPLILTPMVVIAGVIVLVRLLSQVYGWAVALTSGVLIGLLPRFAFDATEPEKAPFVVSLFVFSLAAVYAARTRPPLLLLGGMFISLAMMAHTTGYFFFAVLALSHFALNAQNPRAALSRYSAGAFLMAVAAVGAYLALASFFRQEPAYRPVAVSGGGLLPSFLQTYTDAFRALVAGGFSESAWARYLDGIREQIGSPALLLALGGFAVGGYRCVHHRNWCEAPILLWAAFVTVAFALQYPSSSHGSRYPSYVTPVYVVLACSFVGFVPRMFVAPGIRLNAWAPAGAVALFGAYLGSTYALSPNPGLRDLYASHQDLGEYVVSERLLDDGSGMLYLEWPSLTFNVLRHRAEYGDRLYTYGFGQRDLSEFTAQFVQENRIEYIVYDSTGNDNFGSSGAVLNQLRQDLLLEEVAVFTGRPGSSVTLFRVHERHKASVERIRATIEHEYIAPGDSFVTNGVYCKDQANTFPGWEANGWVSLHTPSALEPCGIRVVNNKEYGGVRQIINRRGTAGEPLTILASLRADEADPARRAKIILYKGTMILAEADAVLSPRHDAYVAVEAYGPSVDTSLRLVIATDAGDEGDLIINAVFMKPGLLNDVLVAPAHAGEE